MNLKDDKIQQSRRKKVGIDNPVEEGDRGREEERRRKEKLYRVGWRRIQEKNPKSTPWLVIRYALTDVGLRPIPAGEAHYLSPDIWVQSSDPTGKAVAGEDNFIHVRVFNLGMANAAPVKIDFYWANPALGLGPANFNLIGTDWVEVKSMRSEVIRCSKAWVPAFVNNGHECLMVNCSNHILDPIVSPFEPRVDRHVGQRNITVLEGIPGETISFSMEINNILSMIARTSILARTEHVVVAKEAFKELIPVQLINEVVAYGGPKTNTPEEMEHRFRENTSEYQTAQRIAQLVRSHKQERKSLVYGLGEHSTSLRGAPRIVAYLSEDLGRILPTKKGRYLANLLLAKDKMVSDIAFLENQYYAAIEDVLLKPFECRRLELKFGIPSDAKPDEYVVFHLKQRAEGMIVGGYAIVVQITTERRKIND